MADFSQSWRDAPCWRVFSGLTGRLPKGLARGRSAVREAPKGRPGGAAVGRDGRRTGKSPTKVFVLILLYLCLRNSPLLRASRYLCPLAYRLTWTGNAQKWLHVRIDSVYLSQYSGSGVVLRGPERAYGCQGSRAPCSLRDTYARIRPTVSPTNRHDQTVR